MKFRVRELEKLLLKLDQCLKEGRQGNVSDEYLDDLRKGSKKSKMSLIDEKMPLEEKIRNTSRLQSKVRCLICYKIYM